jgi:lysozyme
MKESNNLVAAIKGFEQLRLSSYQDKGGIWTIGYGHTYGVKQGQHINERQAEALLAFDIAKARKGLDSLALKNLSQGKYDALIDFIFNIGITKFLSSTLLKNIRTGESVSKIQNEIRTWCHGHDKSGKLVEEPGLVKRRAWEAAQWER